MSVQSAMVLSPSSAGAAAFAAAQATGGPGERHPLFQAVAGGGAELDEKVRADLAGLVISGPGLWLGWLEDLQREGLLGQLLDDGVIGEALAQAPHGHKLDRTLSAKMTTICVLVGCPFPDQGYDSILGKVSGLPGLLIKPGTKVPAGPALSKARALLGEQAMRAIFELDAARADAGPGVGATAFALEVTAFDGTTAEVFNTPELAEEPGVPTNGTKPKIWLAAHVSAGSRRWKAAAIGGYHDGENTLVDQLETTLAAGMLNLADRGFFSMDRLAAVLRYRCTPAVAGQERRHVRPVQGDKGAGRRVRAGAVAGIQRHAGQTPP